MCRGGATGKPRREDDHFNGRRGFTLIEITVVMAIRTALPSGGVLEVSRALSADREHDDAGESRTAIVAGIAVT